MDEQMIELIARAIFEAHNATYTVGGPAKWESDPEHWRRYARAAHSVIAGKVAELEAEVERLTPRYPQPCFDHEYITTGCPDCGKLA